MTTGVVSLEGSPKVNIVAPEEEILCVRSGEKSFFEFYSILVSVPM